MVELVYQGKGAPEAAENLTRKLRVALEQDGCTILASFVRSEGEPHGVKGGRRMEHRVYICPFGPAELDMTPLSRGRMVVALNTSLHKPTEPVGEAGRETEVSAPSIEGAFGDDPERLNIEAFLPNIVQESDLQQAKTFVDRPEFAPERSETQAELRRQAEEDRRKRLQSNVPVGQRK